MSQFDVAVVVDNRTDIQYWVDHITELVTWGFNVTLYIEQIDDLDTYNSLESLDLSIHWLRPFQDGLIGMMLSNYCLYRLLKKRATDVVHLIGTGYVPATLLLKQVRHIIEMPSKSMQRLTSSPSLEDRLNIWIMRKYGNFRTSYITHSEIDHGKLMKAGVGVFNAYTLRPRINAIYDQTYSLPPAMYRVGFLGDLTEKSNLITLIKAAHIANAKGVPVSIMVNGKYQDMVPGGISKNELLSWVNMGLLEWMQDCSEQELVNRSDIICKLNASDDAIPLSLVRAAATGRPMIAVSSPEAHVAIRDGETGYIIDDLDPHSLSDVLVKALRTPEHTLNMGLAAHNRAVADFSPVNSLLIRRLFNASSNH